MRVKWGIAIGLVGFIVGRRLGAPRRMPNLGVWQRELSEKRGEVAAAVLAGRVQARF
jgi:hypothetical protein